MTVTVDAYNVSSLALILNRLPRFIATRNGLKLFENATFDYYNKHYTISLFETFFVFPVALLLVTLIIYVIVISIFDCKSFKSKSYTNDNELAERKFSNSQHPAQAYKDRKLSSFYSLKNGLNPDLFVKRKKSLECKHCIFVWWLIIIGTVVVVISIATFYFTQATKQTDSVLRQFISYSTESKRSLAFISRRYLLADNQTKNTGILSRSVNRIFSRFNTYNTIKSYANETAIDTSQANAQWFQNRFYQTIIFYETSNIFSICILSMFALLLLPYFKIGSKARLIFCLLCLLVITFMASLSLMSGVALSDFCLKAKPIIVDITVNRMPSNNFTTGFVNYYLHCNLNQWNLDKHKQTLFKVINRVDRVFSSNFISGLFSNVRNGIETSYDTFHCSELNRFINLGLSEFCQVPIDSLIYLFISYSTSFFIFTVTLFIITFRM